MNIDDKLQSMVGYTYMYHTKLYKILSYQCKNGKIIIATDKDWIEILKEKFTERINEFLPVSSDNEEKAIQALPGKQELLDLKEVIIDNIKKVKEDPDYIKQTNVINNSVNTLINIVKTQITIIKSMGDK